MADLTDRERYDLVHLWVVQSILIIFMVLSCITFDPWWIAGCMIALRFSGDIFHRIVGW